MTTGWHRRRLELDLELGGSRLTLSVDDRPVPEETGRPVVYLHGLGSTGMDFAPAANAPELAGRRLLAFDLPGSGESRIAAEARPTIEDLVEVVDEALATMAVGRAHLIGHSFSGLTGLLLATRRPDRFASFVNVEGNLSPIDCRVLSRRVTELATRLPAQRVLERLADELGSSGRPGYRRFAERLAGNLRPEALVAYSRSIVELSDGRSLLDLFCRLDLPRLFLYGETNRDLPYLEELRRGGIEVVEIPHSDHFPLDTAPAAFFAALGAFLDRRDHPDRLRRTSVPIDAR